MVNTGVFVVHVIIFMQIYFSHGVIWIYVTSPGIFVLYVLYCVCRVLKSLFSRGSCFKYCLVPTLHGLLST